MQTVWIKVNAFDAIALHKNVAEIPIFSGHSKFKIIFTQKTQLAASIASEFNGFEKNGLIQKLHLHLGAVIFRRLVGDFFGAQGIDPIKRRKRYEDKPE